MNRQTANRPRSNIEEGWFRWNKPLGLVIARPEELKLDLKISEELQIYAGRVPGNMPCSLWLYSRGSQFNSPQFRNFRTRIYQTSEKSDNTRLGRGG